MPESTVSYLTARDGTRLAYRETGTGRPLILLHGFMADATLWLRAGHADALAAHGHRVIMPDFRGHGGSDRPHDPAAYPKDVLTDDAVALVDHLGLTDYDLAGYSLGARIVVRMLVRGAAPARAVVAGQGLRQIQGAGGGAGELLRRVVRATGPFEPGSAEARTQYWMREFGADQVALGHVLDSLAATDAEDLARIQVPTLVAWGCEDARAASAADLAEALPHAERAVLPGDHGTAAAAPELTAALIDFLARA
ncbi:alpha/beta fold hydrolase [Streptomyces beihaiensis]|uniref:Alpha/beta fold hydrolase n=1 Tax=Streptomyces beihaiensis TaxID=2984495 RepID=A0ABT3TXU0_9ACTN|nr:alpha/beta fold hydrolase [Streptomyces beihaiensis]MCX3061635.1 alpha/beta fold hydrolase [Streptomyces beihaiensis]